MKSKSDNALNQEAVMADNKVFQPLGRRSCRTASISVSVGCPTSQYQHICGLTQKNTRQGARPAGLRRGLASGGKLDDQNPSFQSSCVGLCILPLPDGLSYTGSKALVPRSVFGNQMYQSAEKTIKFDRLSYLHTRPEDLAVVAASSVQKRRPTGAILAKMP